MTRLDTYPEGMINPAEFHICTPNSLRRVEASAYTHAFSDGTLVRNINERILNLKNKYRCQDHYNQRYSLFNLLKKKSTEVVKINYWY